MKVLADYKLPDGSYNRILVKNIIDDYKCYRNNHNYLYDLSDFYQDFYSGKLYSTHLPAERKKNMTLRVCKVYENSYFRYYPNQAPKNVSQDTVPHELFKDIICGFQKLVLKYYNQEVTLYISECDTEHQFFANGNEYYADIYFKFDKSEPEEFLYKWNGELFFEIKHTHAVGNKKRKDCRLAKIPVFEHSISEAYLNQISRISNSNLEEAIVNKITNSLQSVVYGKWISDPSSEEYIMIKELQNKVSALENQLYAVEQDSKEALENLENKCKLMTNERNELSVFKSKVESKRILRALLKLYRIK